ncbi:hypothetical protein [Acinetobacter pragensis]|uniref:hypothetical protein n=1 Tax=Acinetobacter pragensis TaxID=1806892 RepID=UPI0010420706|nr:hypothetical protein [Acinetobacter pragensis]
MQTEEPVFFDCMYVQQNKSILTLSGRPIGTIQNNAGNYDLTTTLLHPTTLKILNQFQPVKQIVPASRLDAIKFDRNPYSPQQDLVGIAIYQSHIGGINSSRRLLNLYSTNQQSSIKQVLNGLMTNYQSSTSNNNCDDWNTVELKRTIHLTGKNKNQLPILRIKEHIIDNDYDQKSCHAEISKHQKTYQIQFNGTDYPIQQITKNDLEY